MIGIRNKKLLVTTALKETWGEGQNICFLGEWCNLYGNKKTIETRKYEVLPYHWNDKVKAYKDYSYLKSLNAKILKELAVLLNDAHNKDYSEREWNILIGHWLVKFTSVVFDRWSMIECALNECGENLETIIVNIDHITCVPDNTDESIQFLFDDRWNHFLCGYMIKKWTDIGVIERIDALSSDEELTEKNQYICLSRFKDVLRKVFNNVKSLLFRQSTYLFEAPCVRIVVR